MLLDELVLSDQFAVLVPGPGVVDGLDQAVLDDAEAPGGDEWGFTERLATEAGVLVSPGTLYGAAGAGRVRAALVAPMERLRLVAERLAVQPV